MIEFFNLTQLRNAEFISYGRDVLALFKEHDLPGLGLQTSVTQFEKNLQPVVVKYDQEKGNTLAHDIEKADLRRDNAVIGIRQVADAYTRHFDVAMKKAAEILLKCIARYGNSAIAYQNYFQETESIRRLMHDFETMRDVKDALETLGLQEWADELKDANQDFQVLYQRRMEKEKDDSVGQLKDLRNAARESYESLVHFLVATHTVQPKDVFQELITGINQQIQEYNRILENQVTPQAV
ncbi:MAG TPA: DUF6261 family protein [Catalimonadaceae bacterium]|nr:DUF6261 family protein [Catalimonadaceae bacterium]